MLEPIALPAAETMAFVLGGGVRVTSSLRQNAAITLGRLALKVPQLVAPHLAHFCRPWCRALRTLYDDVEKESAYAGLLAVLRINPEPAVECFADLAGGWHAAG
jgi:transportin-1